MTPVNIGQTALLIFSRTATYEAAVKGFDRSCGKSGNEAIAQRLIRRTIATAHHTQLPVFIHYDTEEATGTFGQRLADAMEAVFSHGYSKVIAIGNDCPDVTVSLLLETSRRLEKNNLILGPANDGGVYLIGIHRADFHRTDFVGLAWETAQLQTGWKQYVAALSIEAGWLEPFDDIDRASDFKALLARLPKWDLLRKQLASILATIAPAAFWDCRFVCSGRQPGLTPLRGPPHSGYISFLCAC